MNNHLMTRATGAPLNRIDGIQKVTGAAKYSYEYPVAGVTYVVPVQSTIARGRIVSLDTSAARALPGVLAVLWHENAPRLAPPRDDQDLLVLQSDAVAYHGQFIAAVVAETLETARQAASLVAVRYEQQPHDVVLSADRGDLFKPEYVPQKPAAFYPADSAHGDVEAALAAAPVSLDHTYTTPAEHHNPMEPHTTLAIWSDDGESVTVYDTCQGVSWRRDEIATAFGLVPERVRVLAPYVGGGFGSRGFTHPYAILAVMAARVAGRPAKLAQTRQQMFGPVGYRSPTIQHLRLGAGRDGRLTAIAHDVVAQTNALFEMTEPAAVATRTMYA
ncbi:MAG: xanthine dehydrogenase family protein molybdopterin-binding subunit, partial [Roseiflexaceae bacterium]